MPSIEEIEKLKRRIKMLEGIIKFLRARCPDYHMFLIKQGYNSCSYCKSDNIIEQTKLDCGGGK